LFLILNSFYPYFTWNFWSNSSHLFYWSKFGVKSNPFEINLIRFENRIGRIVLLDPPVSAALTASPRCLASPPVMSQPTCQPRRPCHADPAALHCRAVTRLPRAPRPGRCHTDATPPHCSTLHTGPPSLPLSLPLFLHAVPTPPPPPRRSP
jgi:hypothetical protein